MDSIRSLSATRLIVTPRGGNMPMITGTSLIVMRMMAMAFTGEKSHDKKGDINIFLEEVERWLKIGIVSGGLWFTQTRRPECHCLSITPLTRRSVLPRSTSSTLSGTTGFDSIGSGTTPETWRADAGCRHKSHIFRETDMEEGGSLWRLFRYGFSLLRPSYIGGSVGYFTSIPSLCLIGRAA